MAKGLHSNLMPPYSCWSEVIGFQWVSWRKATIWLRYGGVKQCFAKQTNKKTPKKRIELLLVKNTKGSSLIPTTTHHHQEHPRPTPTTSAC